jgi:hypothetical protein
MAQQARFNSAHAAHGWPAPLWQPARMFMRQQGGSGADEHGI